MSDQPSRVDIITVPHTDHYYELAMALQTAIAEEHADDAEWTFTAVDNRQQNRGFSRACNIGAANTSSPIIGFLNPDVIVHGAFLDRVRATLATPGVVITGSNFGKSPTEYRTVWGCDDWVCGAAFFVTRDWWTRLKGFDTGYVWSFEETDFIRRTQEAGGKVSALQLPIRHESPSDDPEHIVRYKTENFEASAKRFYARWGARGRASA